MNSILRLQDPREAITIVIEDIAEEMEMREQQLAHLEKNIGFEELTFVTPTGYGVKLGEEDLTTANQLKIHETLTGVIKSQITSLEAKMDHLLNAQSVVGERLTRLKAEELNV